MIKFLTYTDQIKFLVIFLPFLRSAKKNELVDYIKKSTILHQLVRHHAEKITSNYRPSQDLNPGPLAPQSVVLSPWPPGRCYYSVVPQHI